MLVTLVTLARRTEAKRCAGVCFFCSLIHQTGRGATGDTRTLARPCQEFDSRRRYRPVTIVETIFSILEYARRNLIHCHSQLTLVASGVALFHVARVTAHVCKTPSGIAPRHETPQDPSVAARSQSCEHAPACPLTQILAPTHLHQPEHTHNTGHTGTSSTHDNRKEPIFSTDIDA